MASSISTTATLSPFGGWRDLILPAGLIASVLVILVPMPPALMDVLLSINIALAVIILLTTVYVRTPLEFSIFPSLLLATTLARLVLNVATTRLILTRAKTDGALAAGHVVKAFGEFVAANQLVVGLVIFVIIVIIQFVVITKGATRISEVAARFALDGMPGKQMAIDADLNAGLIDQAEAHRRREIIARQADFFGAMDGASKFVRGDAVASILITLVNIFGGLVIGVLQAGMSLSQAADVFTKLTIGDGLVAQVPAFMISLSAGLLVTRSNAETNLPSEFLRQLFGRPQTLAIAGVFLGLLIFTALPKIPLLLIGGGCIALSVTLSRQNKRVAEEAATKTQAELRKKPDERIEDYLSTNPLEIEIGVGLLRLADPKRGGNLLERIQQVRQAVAADLGIVMPKVRVRDNLRLDQTEYRIKIADVPVAEGSLEAGMLLAIDGGGLTGTMRGIETREPAHQRPALWIEPNLRDQAEGLGYKVQEPAGVLASHLAETINQHADEILTRDATKHLVEELRKTSPAVVEELIPVQMKLAEVQRVLQALLREQVPIRQLGAILETLGDCAAGAHDLWQMTELVRQRLARVICRRDSAPDGKLHVITIDGELESRIAAAVEHADRGWQIRLAPREVVRICDSLSEGIEELVRENHRPVVLVSPAIRAALKQLTLSRLPRLAVLSYDEITRDTKVESAALVSDPSTSVERMQAA